MKNNANKVICLWLETAFYRGVINHVVMDSKAHDYNLYRAFSGQRKIMLVTLPQISRHTEEQM